MKFRFPLGESYYDFFVFREMAFLIYPLNIWRRSLVKSFLVYSSGLNINPELILEVGCGSGFFSRILSYRFPNSKILSIDTSERSIKYALDRDLPNVHFERIDFFNVNGSYDLIVSLHVFILLDTEDAFKKIHALLSKGGVAFLTYNQRSFLSSIHQKFYRIVVGDKIEFKNPQYLLELAKKYGLKGHIVYINNQEGSFALILQKS